MFINDAGSQGGAKGKRKFKDLKVYNVILSMCGHELVNKIFNYCTFADA